MNVKCEYEDIVSLRRVFTEPPPLSQREGAQPRVRSVKLTEEEQRRREDEEAQRRLEEEALRTRKAKPGPGPARPSSLAEDAFDAKGKAGRSSKAKGAKKTPSHVDNAFAFLAGACEDDASEDDGEEAWEAAILSLEQGQKKAPRGAPRRAPVEAPSSSAAPKRKPPRTGAWVQKAFMALGCDKDDSDESEEEEASPPEQKRAADFQLATWRHRRRCGNHHTSLMTFLGHQPLLESWWAKALDYGMAQGAACKAVPAQSL
eukprot:s3948_g10.t1